jgi:hypothetical protein
MKPIDEVVKTKREEIALEKAMAESALNLPLPPDMEVMRRKAVQNLSELFGVKEPTADRIRVAVVAGSALASCARLIQAVGARQSMNMSLAAQLSENKDQLRRYIEIAMPEHPLARALPAPQP